MAKHADKVGSLEDFKAPWETDAGEVEIDKDRLKRYIFNLTKDKAQAQDARDEALAKVGVAENERDEAKAELAKGDSSGKITDLEKKVAAETERADKAEGKILRLEVGEEKGLTPKQASRLVGTTKEELEADADEILETFGVKKAAEQNEDGDEDEEDEDQGDLRRTPRGSVTNPGDPSNSGDHEPDYDKIAAEITGSRVSI